MTDMPVCSVDECDGRASTRGWCQKHYQQWRRTGDPLPAVKTVVEQETGPTAIDLFEELYPAFLEAESDDIAAGITHPMLWHRNSERLAELHRTIDERMAGPSVIDLI